ncbi:unnamed protein product [Paramecium pentaurelia]|uniref:Uncharacterized protein n=1 Tax=Paramecium pentaurelia TaxID=43138 RepID=A0A8S1WIZ3_9CILI|nr:unnamed protein product [Paramecium pentaurelia]
MVQQQPQITLILPKLKHVKGKQVNSKLRDIKKLILIKFNLQLLSLQSLHLLMNQVGHSITQVFLIDVLLKNQTMMFDYRFQ